MRLATAALFFTLPAIAQKATVSRPVTPEHTSSLPVTHVSLYKNGVGFFEHTGHVTGNAAVTIDFTSAQLNDVLQSLTAIDLNGGRISGAGYNSTTPLEQQLKTLPIALSDNPTAADFYSAIRGARVEVHSGAASITGRLLSVESRTVPTKSDDTANSPERYFLTVVSDGGDVKTVELTAATSIRVIDSQLHADISRYLQLIDANRSQGLRHLTIDDRGTGTRELHVNYISEVPIWKSTYRILFTNPDPKSLRGGCFDGPCSSPTPPPLGSVTIQGWSVVDNTTGTDWDNVQLSLIAGAPQSFIQPLSQPIYSRRPEIPIAQEAQLTPQTFESGEAKVPAPPPSPTSMSVQVDSVNAAQVESLPMNGRSFAKVARLAPGVAGGIGSSVGAGYGIGGTEYQQLANESIAPATKTTAFDDFFAYNITEPVTIHKNESALVPILQTKIPAESVTLVSFNGNTASVPLRALWLTNNSNFTFDRGSFSLIENGAFGGEGLLEPIHPNEKRLVSYAADQAVRVSVDGNRTDNHVTLLRGSKGVINIHRADVHSLDFSIHNAAANQRTVVLEIPNVPGWKLTSATQPTETTPSVYRFRMEVAPGYTAHLHTSGERAGYTTYYLSRSDDNQFAFILRESGNNPVLRDKLQPILEARAHVADAQHTVDLTNDKIKALHDDEDRQRANITALANSDKASRERFVNELNKTEDDIKAQQATLATQQQSLEAAKADLSVKIDAFSIDEKVGAEQ